MSFSPTLAVLQQRADDIRAVARFSEQRGRINCVAFSPDNRRLAIGGSSVWLADAGDDQRSLRKVVHDTNLDKITWVSFSPNGKVLAACDFGSIHIWHFTGMTEVRTDRQPRALGLGDQSPIQVFASNGRNPVAETEPERMAIVLQD